MNIYSAITAVMDEIGAVGKDSRNEQQKYMFRGIDAVMNALNPALRKAHIFVVPEVLESTREERAGRNGGVLIYTITKVKYTFYAEDGSSVSAVVVGEGMDSGDKSANKAMSAAFKYACFQTFCIPTEEMNDSETDNPEPLPKEPNTQNLKEPVNGRKAKISAAERKVLECIFSAWGPDGIQFACWAFGVKSIEDFTGDMYIKAASGIQRMKAKYHEEKAKGSKWN